MREDLAHPVGHALRIALRGAFPCELHQRLLRREVRLAALFRILVLELREQEGAALCDPDCARKRFRVARKQAVHLFGWFEKTIRVPLTPEAEGVDRHVVADGGDDILHDATPRFVKQHVIGHDGLDAQRRREVRQLVQPELVVRPAAQRQCEVAAIAERLAQAAQPFGAGRVGVIREKDGDQALAIGDDIAPLEMALRLAGAALAFRQQAAQPRIGGAIGRIGQQREAVSEVEAAANDEAHARHLGGFMRPDDAGQGIAVDNAERLDAEHGRLREQFFGAARSPQKREVRRRLQLDIARAAHAKIPCKYQRCEPVSPCSPSPARKIQNRSPPSSSTRK